MIYVCDAIMSAGKSSAAITYMNEHPDKRFIYITPYKSETVRIQNACPRLKFVRPSKKIPEYHFLKTEHTAALIKDGCNIATTHQAFREFRSEMKQDIIDHGYTLIIDEDVSLLESFEYEVEDLKMAIDADRVRTDGETYVKGNIPYNGTTHKRMISLLDSRELMSMTCKDGCELFYWMLPIDLLQCFEDVFILTYIFKAQSLHHLLEMNHMEYSYINVDMIGDRYSFTEGRGWQPDCVRTLRDKIHVFDNKKLNAIGNRETSLSINWMQNNSESVKKLKNAIYNFFINYNKDVPVKNRMWGTYKGAMNKLKGRGYTNAFLPFNIRATNDYSDRTALVYAVNIYMNVNQKQFYIKNGIQIDREQEDLYALSTMVQWIWRSAIRNGEDINIYIPSRRMRTLLINWMDSLAEGGDSSVSKPV